MHPILIAGAALVGLPILLHLIMKQEPRRLPFPAFRFLKEKLKTNQRKLRLRHFILLAMRMLLIALFALTLFQPSVLSDGLISLSGTQPLAAVLIIDTSPSMGYADAEGKTRLEEACRRATELVNQLPPGSRVAIIETGDPGGDWLPSESDARSRLADLTKRAQAAKGNGTATGGSQPVTSALATAYQLLRTVDQESDASDPLPRLIAVFTDRTAASWDPARVEDLKKLRDGVPDPKPAHAVVDVGTDAPVNVAILAAEITSSKSQIVPANQPVSITITVGSVGREDLKVTASARLDDARDPLRQEIDVPRGQARTATFDFRDLKPGLHQLAFELDPKDALLADNTRFLTFRVREARKVLTIADDPAEAFLWKLALDSRGEFACDVVKPEEVKADALAAYEVVVMFAVSRPNQPGDPLWPKLRQYAESGGKLVIIPGGKDRMALEEYDPAKVEAANVLMPGTFKDVLDTRERFKDAKEPKDKDRANGVMWSILAADANDRAFQHPMIAPMKDWKLKGNVDVFQNPRRTWKYWDVEKAAEGNIIVTYNDADDPGKRHPALLERTVIDAKDKTPKGKVILLTTRMDVPTDADREWHDYWDGQNSWTVAFPELLLRYAAGDSDDASFTFLTGQTVTVPLAKLLGGKRETIVLDGPGISVTDAVITPAEHQSELRIGPPRTNTPGNFKLEGPNPDWKEGYSLNSQPEESTLDKVPAEAIEDLTGKGSVLPVDKDLNLEEALSGLEDFKTPFDLFPWLLIAVLMLLVLESFVANRFYRRPTGK